MTGSPAAKQCMVVPSLKRNAPAAHDTAMAAKPTSTPRGTLRIAARRSAGAGPFLPPRRGPPAGKPSHGAPAASEAAGERSRRISCCTARSRAADMCPNYSQVRPPSARKPRRVRYHRPSALTIPPAMMSRLCLCLWALLPLLACAQDPTALVFGINEGVTYRISAAEVRERYREIADDLAKLLRRPVRIESMDDYVQMGKDLAAVRYDLAYVHPAHYAIRAIDKAHYRLLAVTKGYTDYRASFLVRRDAAFKSLADPAIHQVGMPDADSITAWIVRATLRDALGLGTKQLRLRYTRYQDAVPFMVEYGFVEVGATAAASVIKAFIEKGGRVLLQSRPVPIKELIASPGLPPQDFARIQQYFLHLDLTEDGQRRLAKLGYSGFASYDEAALIGIGQWLEGTH